MKERATPRRPRVIALILLCAVGASVARSDDSSKAAKIAELLQLTQARQFLHSVDGRFDQEEAARAWGRFYSENLTESDLDAILAYYRSPVGQKDVSASRAALPEVQHYMLEKRTAATSAAAKNTTVPRVTIGSPATGGATAPDVAAPSATKANTATANAATADAATADVAGPSATGRAWDSNPLAPNGRVIPNSASAVPERCDVALPTAPGIHAVPPSGRSVVCVCTDEKGALTRDPVIAESSGDARVDSGAVKMARSDSGRYVPPTLDGRPQSACFRFAIDFRRHQ